MQSGPTNPLKVDTEMVVEMGLVAEFAHGSMEEWGQRSWADRRAWVYYKILHNAKVKEAEKTPVENPMILGPNGKPANMEVMPHVVHDRPGVRN